MTIPFGDVETLFLDAGNTILSMDYGLLSEWVAVAGPRIEPAQLERAEAAARPAVSRFLDSGTSTEARETLEVYAGSMLEAAAGTDVLTSYPGALPQLLAILRDAENWDRLWSKTYEGIPAALDRARTAGLRLVVVSNSDGTIESKLERVGLAGKFDAVVDSALCGFEKPDPRIFEHALAVSGADRATTLHAGDLYSVDVRGARSAGLHAILLDPFGNWKVDCETVASVPRLIDLIRAA